MYSAVPTGAVLRLTKTGLEVTHRKTTSTLDNASASTSNDSRPVASDRSRSVPRPDVASPDDPDAHANASSVCYLHPTQACATSHAAHGVERSTSTKAGTVRWTPCGRRQRCAHAAGAGVPPWSTHPLPGYGDDDYDPQHTSDRLDAVQPGSETSGIHARCRSRVIRGHGLESGAPTWAGRLSRRVALTPGTRPDILLALIVAEC